MNTNEIYAQITDRVLANLESAGSWNKLWSSTGAVSLNGHYYTGINQLILACMPYEKPVYGTFQQVRLNGGYVKKGEHATLVVFWKRITVKDTASGKEEIKYLLRHYYVFNVAQCEFDSIGLEKISRLAGEAMEKKDRSIKADQVIASMPKPVKIVHDNYTEFPYYAPHSDRVVIPEIDCFNSSDAYYATLFHEVVHSTGHPSRLDRFRLEGCEGAFGSNDYSKEELVAELGSAYLQVMSDINLNIKNTAAYIRSWSNVLKENERWIVWAASRAEKAADYILGNVKVEEEAEVEHVETEAA